MHIANLPKNNELRDFARHIFATACTESATDTKQTIGYLSKALNIEAELIDQWMNDAPASRQPTRAEAVAAYQCSARYHQCTAVSAYNDARMHAGIARCAQDKLAATEAILRKTLAELEQLKKQATPTRYQAANDAFMFKPYRV